MHSFDEARERRASILRELGAKTSEVEALLRYNDNSFELDRARTMLFPLSDEPFVSYWDHCASLSQNLWEHLVASIPQLSFSVSTGRSSDPIYLAATRSGIWQADTSVLGIQDPGRLKVFIERTPAGGIPILVVTVRHDFERLVQALSKRNEPVAIPSSMGACMISGLNNWARVRHYRATWEGGLDRPPSDEDWKNEMRILISRKELYQDRLIILSNGPYSGVSADQMGLKASKWSEISLAVRCGHECAHYFTRRVLGSMRNNLLDELIADYCGIRKALGRYESSWFCRFLGLEDFPAYRSGARLENYCVDASLSASAISILQALVYRSSQNLQRFDRLNSAGTPAPLWQVLLALASSTLEELAADDAPQTLVNKLAVYSNMERISVQ